MDTETDGQVKKLKAHLQARAPHGNFPSLDTVEKRPRPLPSKPPWSAHGEYGLTWGEPARGRWDRLATQAMGSSLRLAWDGP